MINDSVRAKTKHDATYLQSTCSCGQIGREWKGVDAAHTQLDNGKEQEDGTGKRKKKERIKGKSD